MNTYNIIKKIETKSAIITRLDNGIIRVIFKENTEITPEELKENFSAYNSIVCGEKYPFLISAANGFVNYTNEARLYARENEDAFPKICIALYGTNLAHKIVANFYLRYNKPRYPHKIFDKIEEAEAWCLKQALKQQVAEVA